MVHFSICNAVTCTNGKRTQGLTHSEIIIFFITWLEIVVTLVQQVKRSYLTGNELYLILLYFFLCVNEFYLILLYLFLLCQWLLSHFVVFFVCLSMNFSPFNEEKVNNNKTILKTENLCTWYCTLCNQVLDC